MLIKEYLQSQTQADDYTCCAAAGCKLVTADFVCISKLSEQQVKACSWNEDNTQAAQTGKAVDSEKSNAADSGRTVDVLHGTAQQVPGACTPHRDEHQLHVSIQLCKILSPPTRLKPIASLHESSTCTSSQDQSASQTGTATLAACCHHIKLVLARVENKKAVVRTTKGTTGGHGAVNLVIHTGEVAVSNGGNVPGFWVGTDTTTIVCILQCNKIHSAYANTLAVTPLPFLAFCSAKQSTFSIRKLHQGHSLLRKVTRVVIGNAQR